MSGSTNWSEYAIRTSWGISKFDWLTRIPDERREASTSCMAMEIMSAVALRMVFATDRLTPARRWSQTAKMQTIFTITAPGTRISVPIISRASQFENNLAPFRGLGSLGLFGAGFEDTGCAGVCGVGRLSFFSCSRRVEMLTKLPGC